MGRRLELEEKARAERYGSRRRMQMTVLVVAPLCMALGLAILMIGMPHLMDLVSGAFKVIQVRQITRRLVVFGFNVAGVLIFLWGVFLIPKTLALYKKYKERGL